MAVKKTASDTNPYRCMCCGKLGKESDFHSSPYSPLWMATGQKVLSAKPALRRCTRQNQSDTVLRQQ